jgi:hypothetical protein
LCSIEKGKIDPGEAISYLNTALEEYEKDKDNGTFLLGLRMITEVRMKGGFLKCLQWPRIL